MGNAFSDDLNVSERTNIDNLSKSNGYGWDISDVRSLILQKKIAPQCSGSEFISKSDSDALTTIVPNISKNECPICFLYFEEVNWTECCNKPICTGCFLRLKPPKKSVLCPYCNYEDFSVKYISQTLQCSTTENKQENPENNNLTIATEIYKSIPLISIEERKRIQLKTYYQSTDKMNSQRSDENSMNGQLNTNFQELDSLLLIEAINQSMYEYSQIEKSRTEQHRWFNNFLNRDDSDSIL